MKNTLDTSKGGINIFKNDASIQKQGNEFLTLDQRELSKRSKR